MRQDEFHARKSEGLGNIDLANLRMCVSAAQNARVKHSGKMNVPAVGGLAGDALDGVNARGTMADRLE